MVKMEVKGTGLLQKTAAKVFLLLLCILLHPFECPASPEMFYRGKNEVSSVLVKSMGVLPGDILVAHKTGKETVLDISFLSERREVKPEVYRYPLSDNPLPVEGFSAFIEEVDKCPVKTGMLWSADPAAKLFHVSVKVLSQEKSGLYIVSLGGKEAFVVNGASTEKVALYCPEGFWSAVRRQGLTFKEEGKPYYFHVPSNLKELEIYLARPHRIKTPKGRVFLEAAAENTGRITIPVKRRGGVWSIEPAFYGGGSLGVSPPSFAKLLNIEPIVAFGSPTRLPVQNKALSKTPLVTPETNASLEFVPGISGQAVRLKGGKTLVFPRGRDVPEGGYANFPGEEGTIEFWFKPDIPSSEIPISQRPPFKTANLIRGPHVNLKHLYGAKNWNRCIYSDLQIELLTDHDEPSVPKKGFQESWFFSSDRWTHLAFTWHLSPAAENKDRLPGEDMLKSVVGSLEWPEHWRVFGPVDRTSQLLPAGVLNSYPETVEIEGEKFEGVDVRVKGTNYDFPEIMKGQPTGKTVYVFLLLNSTAEQEVTLGMAADWWMQAWVNGELVHDTWETGNIKTNFIIWDHLVNVNLKKGRNILAVRFGKATRANLALGGPDQLRFTPNMPLHEIPPAEGVEGEFNIFVNGKKLEGSRSILCEPFLTGLTGWDIFSLSDNEQNITVGPFDGSMDTLRFSDTVRYKEDFVPPEKDPELDVHTRTLFFFDGDLKGVSVF